MGRVWGTNRDTGLGHGVGLGDKHGGLEPKNHIFR